MGKESIVNRFNRREAMFDAAASRLVKRIRKVIEYSGFCSLAFSGNHTNDKLFAILAKKYRNAEFWTRVQLFWLDELCIPGDDPESNYGRAWRSLSHISSLSPANVHRINAENSDGAEQYTALLNSGILLKNDTGLPVFDVIVLGLGVSGQVAALLPYSPYINDTEKVLVARVAEPKTEIISCNRITVTLPVINASQKILFVVCGKEKIDVVQHVINQHDEEYPASLIQSPGKRVEWYISL